jgi:hypothetical protein
MKNIIEDFPVTIILALVGIAIGLLVPSPFHDFIVNFSFENAAQDPAGTLTGYVIGMPIAMIGEVFVKLITGLIFSLVGMIIGIIIDINKNSGGYGL